MSALEPYWTDGQVTVHLGDCLDVLPSLPDCSVDAVVTDPPYGLTELPTERVLQALSAWLAGDRTHVPSGKGFMGRDRDKFVPPPGVWDECLRVMKPGAYLLAFASPRTQDLMTLSIRLAGFEIRDGIKWIYGQGMPHGLNVAKAIAAGGGPEAIRRMEMGAGYEPSGRGRVNYDHGGGSVMNGSTAAVDLPPEAARWEGWNTQLKPSHEPIVMAQKPLAGTVASNVVEFGTGALNVGACRVRFRDQNDKATVQGATWYATANKTFGKLHDDGEILSGQDSTPDAGRWPPNILLDEEMAAELDRQSGTRSFAGQQDCVVHRGADSGGASRYFPQFGFNPGERIESNVCGDASTRGASTSAGKRTESNGDNSLTAGNGNKPTDLSQMDTRSTIGTTIPSTTTSATSCASPLNGMTTTISGSANNIAGLMGSSSGDVSDARDGNLSASTTSGELVPGRDTASPVSVPTGESGLASGATSSMRDDANGGQPDSVPDFPVFRYEAKASTSERPRLEDGTTHCTVKPLGLIRWLCRLVTPPGGLILDPFAGSGTTAEACIIEGFPCLLIDKDKTAVRLIRERLRKDIQPDLFGAAS